MVKDIDSSVVYATTVLEHIGFTVGRIPTDYDHKKADLRVGNDTGSFVVEVKTRIPNQDDLAKRVENAPPGKIEQFVDRLGNSGSMSNDFQTAAEQLARTRKRSDLFGCIMVILNPAFGIDFEKKTIRATLLGERGAFIKTKEGRDGHAAVFYAGFSDFYRYRDLDCAISICDGGAELLCNKFSPRIEAVRGSALYRIFKDKNAAVDPGSSISPNSYIADSVDRKDTKAVCAHLTEKYGDEFITLFDWSGVAGVTWVPN